MITEAFNYKKWADERTLGAISHINKVEFSEPYSFVLQQINHIVIVEELFRSRLENRLPPHQATNTDIVSDLDELKSRLKESGSWYIKYSSNLNSDKSKDTISFKFSDGKSGLMRINEILFHILNHGSYHRGSIAHALDLVGVPHPIDGYGVYIHEKEPARREKT